MDESQNKECVLFDSDTCGGCDSFFRIKATQEERKDNKSYVAKNDGVDVKKPINMKGVEGPRRADGMICYIWRMTGIDCKLLLSKMLLQVDSSYAASSAPTGSRSRRAQ